LHNIVYDLVKKQWKLILEKKERVTHCENYFYNLQPGYQTYLKLTHKKHFTLETLIAKLCRIAETTCQDIYFAAPANTSLIQVNAVSITTGGAERIEVT
jgi:hypothetical protein